MHARQPPVRIGGQGPGSSSGERPYASYFDDLEAIPMEDGNILWLVVTQSDWPEHHHDAAYV
jgi:hypothetical protein